MKVVKTLETTALIHFKAILAFVFMIKFIRKKYFLEPIDEYFVGIIHLKLNNGIYIGTGSDFIDEIHQILIINLKRYKTSYIPIILLV